MPASDPHDLRTSGLRPPRFSLRTLLVAITLLSCLFALMSAVGVLWSAVLALFLCLVFAHVLGNSLGTRLRDQASRQIEVERGDCPPPATPPRAHELADAPRQLSERSRLHRVTLLMAAGGAFIGAELGGLGVAAIYPQATVAAVALGVVSAAVLGALAGFMTSSFIAVIHQALAEAHRGAQPHVKRQVPGAPR